MSRLPVWILAARPKTLTAALVPIIVGSSLAYAIYGVASFFLGVFALVSTFFIQIGTNLINDSLDFKKGADTAERIGPRRVTQSGLVSGKKVWWGGLLCFFLAALFGIPLIYVGGVPIIAIGIFSLIAGYIYTGGPYPLAYLGLGDFFVLLFFGWIAVGGMYFLHTGQFDLAAFVAGSQVGLLATVLIAINNLRDHLTDRKARKQTLPVRLGTQFGQFEIACLAFSPFLIGIFWYAKGFKWAFLLPYLMLPLAIMLVRKIFSTKPSTVFNKFLAQGALLQLGFGILLAVGFILR